MSLAIIIIKLDYIIHNESVNTVLHYEGSLKVTAHQTVEREVSTCCVLSSGVCRNDTLR